jgi:2-polyprenyl-3-methyl-5-hydroxy-6-metoxy-1,4-benzoquinol methylase
VTQWNHNTHYHSILLGALPGDAQRALDVGCGEGLLTRQLGQAVPEVVGIDSDRRSIDLARERSGNVNLTYVVGDFLTYPFDPESFDAVLAVAVLHHVDTVVGLTRMGELLRPGGVLGIVGLARSTLADLPYDLLGAVVSRFHRRRQSWYDPVSPTVWPPPQTFPELRLMVRELLPGAQFQRHVLWRYSVIWRKPC